jgi:aryl carrier-like protein
MPTAGDSPEGIAQWLTTRVASYIAVEPDHIDRDLPLVDYGLDSVYAVNLCGEIEDASGCT